MKEPTEVIDDNFNVLKVVPRKEIIDKNLKHKTVLIIVKNNKNQIYAAQRKHTKKIFPLKWIVGAGGAVNANESFEEAAKRELKEELGFISEIKYIFDFDYDAEFNNYKARVYFTIYNGKIILNNKEFEQGKWVSVKELKKMIKNKLLCPDTAQFTRKYLDKFYKK